MSNHSIDPKTVLKTARQFRKEGNIEESISTLFEALRRDLLSAEDFDKAGRFILNTLKELKNGNINYRILILGQCTLSWLKTSITAASLARNCLVEVIEGEYDNTFQDLIRFSENGSNFDCVILFPWNQRLLSDNERTTENRISDELTFWKNCWEIVINKMEARLIQVGYDYLSPTPEGYHIGNRIGGGLDLIRKMNTALSNSLPEGAYFIDLESNSGEIGRNEFYSYRRYFWTKQPFSEIGTKRLAEHLFAGIRALTTGPKKVLIIDLDNTIWGGVVGELGPNGIELGESPEGEAFREFQKFLKSLSKNGILLAVCSKNNPEDAQEAFKENADMILNLSDISAFEASWDPKSIMIEKIADTLNLGLDSFVFFDDHPAEREHIRQMLPQVEVVDVPSDPSHYIPALCKGLWFESLTITEDDRKRSGQYQVEGKRRQLQNSFSSMEEYLNSLDMIGDIREVDDKNIQRVIQLLSKTNQFNLTTRRHSLEDVMKFLKNTDVLALTLSVKDRFGDYGLIALVIGVPLEDIENKTVRIDTFLMSCRIIGRTVEQYFFCKFVEKARDAGFNRIRAEYIPTPKNMLVSRFYDNLEFTRVKEDSDGTVQYELLLENYEFPPTFVTPRE